MFPAPFDYHRPGSVDETLALLQQYDDGNSMAEDSGTLLDNAATFEREAREAPEQYIEGIISGPEADREVEELRHLSEIARDMVRRDRH